MLGEGLTTAAPEQFMRFDEQRFDHRRRFGKRGKWMLAVAAAIATAIAIAL